MNLYQAFITNPVNFIDPFGLETDDDIDWFDYWMAGMAETGFKIINAFSSTKDKITNPLNIMKLIASIPELPGDVGRRMGENIRKSLDEGMDPIGAISLAFAKEGYELTPIEEVKTFLDPNASADERSQALIDFEIKMATYIAIAKSKSPVEMKAVPTNDPHSYVFSRIQELKKAIPKGARGRITMSVAVTEDEFGRRVILIGTSEPRGYLRTGIVLQENEVIISGLKHAEQDIIDYATKSNLKIISIGATRNICPTCVKKIKPTGGVITTAQKK